MRLFLIRHADAEAGDPDELRRLSPAGREQARALGEQLAADGVRADAVLTSPLLRARETGEALADALDCTSEPSDALAPGATAAAVRSAVEGRGETVVVVGHQPDCGQTAGRNVGVAPAGRKHQLDSATVTPVVSVRGLTKSYRDFEALKGVDFELRGGEVFGLLGPNGAGKTTTIEILEGYRRRDDGEVEVLGSDPESAGLDWRGRIGVVLQSSAMYENLTVTEQLAQFAGYYEHPRPVDEVIEVIGLEEKRDTRARRLSGGQRRRLDLGLALIGDPELIFLDEPTTGFDPGARRRAWETIRSLSGLGKTILLTTHYLDEVEQLADRVAVLREGRIVASGTVQELVGGAPATEIRYRRNGEVVVVETDEPTRVLHELTEAAIQRGEELDGLEVRKPSLEEVYLSLTQAEPE